MHARARDEGSPKVENGRPPYQRPESVPFSSGGVFNFQPVLTTTMCGCAMDQSGESYSARRQFDCLARRVPTGNDAPSNRNLPMRQSRLSSIVIAGAGYVIVGANTASLAAPAASPMTGSAWAPTGRARAARMAGRRRGAGFHCCVSWGCSIRSYDQSHKKILTACGLTHVEAVGRLQ
jgi:hypothetical protein